MLQGAIRRQADIDALLRRAGIPKEWVGAPMARVSQAQFAALIRIVTWRLRAEFWGLCSHPVRVGTFASA
ncbi:AraC family transcriptional regulator ligand-binding domain-containing protein (plasmid) [Nitrobacteraceae bacterium UC4449_H16]